MRYQNTYSRYNEYMSFNWINASYLILSPFVAVFGLWWWIANGYANWSTIILALVYAVFCELSITAGYHRLFSHQTYKAHPIVRAFFLVFGACALQGSAICWSIDHRIHHRNVDDNEKDPYSINRGFWWAHMGWLLYKKDEQLKEDINHQDLLDDPLVRFQYKYWVLIALVAGFLLPGIIAGLGWGDFIGGVLVAGVVRTVVNHHSTFLINSLSHISGSQTYSDSHSARDNWFTAFLTFGEGFHNFHHEFPSDYRNGVRFYHFDPTKWLINGLSRIGLTSNLLRVRQEIIVRKRIAMKEKRLSKKFSRQWSLPELRLPKRALVRIRKRIELAGRQLSELRNNYEALRREKRDASDIQAKIAQARNEFRHEVYLWKSMSRRFRKLAYQYA
jgi:stearoyl-CoA desaturase (delta-9 desaturase)